MTTQQIYDKFALPPNLRLHQLRVAGIAQLIISGMDNFPHDRLVITACLLHDLGNFAKFKLTPTEDWLQPEGFEYWQSKQQEFITNYDPDEKIATQKMLKELNIPDEVYALIKNIDDETNAEMYDLNDLPLLICKYGDERVSPTGVVTLFERLLELGTRYEKYRGEEVQKYTLANRTRLEAEIQSHTQTALSEINHDHVEKLIPNLLNFSL